MEFAQIQAFLFVLMSICGGVVAVAGASAVVVRIWKLVHKDTEKNTEDISEVMKFLASDKRRIEVLESDQDEMKAQNKMLLKGVYALMCHELDGNHTTQLTESRDEIFDYLFTVQK